MANLIFHVSSMCFEVENDFQEALENEVSTRSSLTPGLSSIEKEEGENIPLSIQHFKKRKSKQVDPSAFNDVFADTGESLEHSEV